MAIIIPSSKIYNPQNAKIRDNVIERIEVGAVEVVPDNEYETPVYNEAFTSGLETTTESKVGNLGFNLNGLSGATYYSWALISSSQSFFTVDLSIPKVQNNKYINKIYDKKKDNGENWIGVSVAYKVKTGTATAPVTNILYSNTYEMISYNLGAITKSSPTKTEDKIGNIPSAGTTHSHIANSAPVGSQAIATSTLTLTQQDNISTITYDDSDTNFIKFNGITILSSSKTTKLGYGQATQLGSPTSITLSGEYVDYEAVSIEITIYGNTIGIDLTDKTLYINGETQKKVYSVDGNELMQVSNYKKYNQVLSEGTDYWVGQSSTENQTYYYTSVHLYNSYPQDTYIFYTMPDGTMGTTTIKAFAITHSLAIASTGGFVTIDRVYRENTSSIYDEFTNTRKLYEKGKETAVIRCSISDYYDENGEKIISIDKSTGRMSFKEYDEVIPMVYGADGKDYPMSLVNGKAKVFQILGAKKYYDGAVWQELSLQEVGELELPEEEPEVQQLTAPTIALDGNTLTMTATDNNTQEFVIFVGGVETATVEV